MIATLILALFTWVAATFSVALLRAPMQSGIKAIDIGIGAILTAGILALEQL